MKLSVKLIPLSFLALGVFLLMQVILPIASFEIWWMQQQGSAHALVSPSVGGNVLGVSVQNQDDFPAIVSNLKRESVATYKQFNLSIPKLNIDQAVVDVDSNDLSKDLAHLPGSALPGEKGNMFISGHSIIGSFLNYHNGLFVNLTSLKPGDQIIITAKGSQFKYQIISLTAVDPKDISVVLPPEPLGRYISLMTCVPPGLNFKRLIVLGKIM